MPCPSIKVTDVSEEHDASIFNKIKRPISNYLTYINYTL